MLPFGVLAYKISFSGKWEESWTNCDRRENLKKQMKLVDIVVFFFALLPKLVQEEDEEPRS